MHSWIQDRIGVPPTRCPPHLALQVAVGLLPASLCDPLPVVSYVGQDPVQTGFYGGVRLVQLTSSHVIVEDSDVLDRQQDRQVDG